jgi:hypothetical protein
VVVEHVQLSDVGRSDQLHRRLREQGIAIDILINNSVTDSVRSTDRFWAVSCYCNSELRRNAIDIQLRAGDEPASDVQHFVRRRSRIEQRILFFQTE